MTITADPNIHLPNNSFNMHFNTPRLLILLLLMALTRSLSAQGFIHPGIDQTEAELEYMKQQVQAGAEPWKSAFDRMQATTDLDANIEPHTHVIRGPYGRPNIGGRELSQSADMAYDCALLWYITGERRYADKAMQILQDWSATLRSFDYNDAKLLAGWTGYQLCNAAEILRYSDARWPEAGQEAFTEMLMTVYYPLLRDYFPAANGNWDGAIAHSLLAIGVFTDNSAIFNDALDHLLYAPINGSIFKYLFPTGQCQESVRDQGHVQLGLEEFAGAARIARTQGIDLFSLGNYRIALGFEYTAQFLLGDTPHCYGIISQRQKEFRDSYEFVYRHYQSMGVNMPYTARIADSVRTRSVRNLLTAFPVPTTGAQPKRIDLEPGLTPHPVGAQETFVARQGNYIVVEPGQSLQEALDKAATKSGTVLAKAGVHQMPETLRIPSNVTLTGEGIETILFLDPASGMRDAIHNAEPDMHDVTIANLVIEGYTKTEYNTDPNSDRAFKSRYGRGGILFLNARGKSIKNIRLENLTVKNCTTNGVSISGGEHIEVIGCNFDENGASVVPGPRQLHNLSVASSTGIVVKDSRLVTSPNGCGIKVYGCEGVQISGCELSRNGWAGIGIAESSDIVVENNFLEANDETGILLEHFYKPSKQVVIRGNRIQFNGGKGIDSNEAAEVAISGNILSSNRKQGTGRQLTQLSGAGNH